MTTLELMVGLKARRAASRQYADASERFAQRALRELHDGSRDRAKWMALYANDIRRWARQEVCE